MLIREKSEKLFVSSPRKICFFSFSSPEIQFFCSPERIIQRSCWLSSLIKLTANSVAFLSFPSVRAHRKFIQLRISSTRVGEQHQNIRNKSEITTGKALAGRQITANAD
jgi:hypothetical protein